MKHGRVRASGAGSKPAQKAQLGIDIALGSLLDGNIVGDPKSLLSWTTLSTKDLVNTLAQGVLCELCHCVEDAGSRSYSFQQNKKYIESGAVRTGAGSSSTFQQSALFIMFGYLVVSVDV